MCFYEAQTTDGNKQKREQKRHATLRDTSEDKWELVNEIFREHRGPRQQGKSRAEKEE